MKRISLVVCVFALLFSACADDDSFVARPDPDSKSSKSSSSSAKMSSGTKMSSSTKESSDDEESGYYSNDRDLDIPSVLVGCKSEEKDECEYGSIKDSRDDQTYKTVKIGDQWWMAENLNYDAGSYSSCYDTDSANCEKYGRLYEWTTASHACPEGWELPSTSDWQTLFDAVGGELTAGLLLKSSEGWEYEGNGIDAFGFSMLPAGSCLGNLCYGDSRKYGGIGSTTAYWTSEDQGSGNSHEAVRCYPYYLETSCYWLDTDYRFSVRCIKK